MCDVDKVGGAMCLFVLNTGINTFFCNCHVHLPCPVAVCHCAAMTRIFDSDRVLSELEISAKPFAICALEGACSMGMARAPHAMLHYVLSGSGRITFAARPAITLQPGQLVLVPGSMGHSLVNAGQGQVGIPQCKPAGLDIEHHVIQGEGAGNMIVLCATLSLGLRNAHGLIDLLRHPIWLNIGQSVIATHAMAAMIAEMSEDRIGKRSVIRVLLLQCITELFRTKLEEGDPAVSWMTGLADPGLWQALGQMLNDPGGPHSLEGLADAIGMSRSRFAARFQEVYGQGPMGFLRELRMARAAQMLLDGREPVKRIAQAVGFTSRTAFSRAFTERWGQTPRAFRQNSER